MKLSSILLAAPAALALGLGGATAAGAVETGPVPTDGPTRVYDPSTLTPVPNGGGLLAPDGTNICATEPEQVIGPDGTLLCFTGVVAGPEGTGVPGLGVEEPTQVERVPVGGADTGVTMQTAPAPTAALALGGGTVVATAVGGYLLARRRTTTRFAE